MVLSDALEVFQVEQECLGCVCLLRRECLCESEVGEEGPGLLEEPACFPDEEFAVDSAGEVASPVVTGVTGVGEEVICLGLVGGDVELVDSL